jgi:hypothetical protein
MVLTVYFVVSLVSRLVATIPSAMRSIVARLIPASGYQDATTSPSAILPFVSRQRRVHRTPAQRFVTIAKRPSYRAGMAQVPKDDLPVGESEIFLAEGMDSVS